MPGIFTIFTILMLTNESFDLVSDHFGNADDDVPRNRRPDIEDEPECEEETVIPPSTPFLDILLCSLRFRNLQKDPRYKAAMATKEALAVKEKKTFNNTAEAKRAAFYEKNNISVEEAILRTEQKEKKKVDIEFNVKMQRKIEVLWSDIRRDRDTNTMEIAFTGPEFDPLKAFTLDAKKKKKSNKGEVHRDKPRIIFSEVEVSSTATALQKKNAKLYYDISMSVECMTRMFAISTVTKDTGDKHTFVAPVANGVCLQGLHRKATNALQAIISIKDTSDEESKNLLLKHDKRYRYYVYDMMLMINMEMKLPYDDEVEISHWDVVTFKGKTFAELYATWFDSMGKKIYTVVSYEEDCKTALICGRYDLPETAREIPVPSDLVWYLKDASK